MTPALLPSVVAICIGASTGAVLRWQLAEGLNTVFPQLPLGTLLANLVGGYLMGLAMAIFAGQGSWSPEWRLLVMTGFLGGLTTFSAFSAEVVTMLQDEKWVWAAAIMASHVLGTLMMTILGIYTVRLLTQGA